MYVDDIILLSISVTDMHKLVHICIDYLNDELDLPVNIQKCNFLRIGRRFNSTCAPISISYNTVTFTLVQEVRYLGVYIVSEKKFNCNYRTARMKFFRASNSIYEKVGNKDSVTLLISLLATQCTPISLYEIDAAGTDNNELKRLCNWYDRAFMKIFKKFFK